MPAKVTFGQLKRLDLRSIWSSESRHFTPWLAENIQELGNVLGMDLEITASEAPVGDFAVDLLTRDLGSGSVVVIESQFGPTDHDHLGKLLTYASGLGASAVVWIAESIREEHRQALEWLNQRTDADTMFFAIVLEVLQIDESQPAFNFRLVVFPNKWQKATHGAGVDRPSARGEAYREYFQKLIDALREKHKFTGARVAQPQNWYTFASGYSGAVYGSSFAQAGRVRVELYIDEGDYDQNKKLFDWLEARKGMIEQSFGEKLEWERLDDRRASRVAVYRPGDITSDEATLGEIRSWSIDRLLKFKAVLMPLLKEYSTSIR